jgi:hypothetical protein
VHHYNPVTSVASPRISGQASPSDAETSSESLKSQVAPSDSGVAQNLITTMDVGLQGA